MMTPHFIDVNTRQQKTSFDIFDRPPLLTSSNCDWSNIYLEYHQQQEVDTSEIYNCNHVLFINLSRRCKQGDFWLNGQFQKVVFTQPGAIAVKPAEATHRFVTKDHGEFIAVQIKPEFIEQVGQNWTDSANIELIPRYYPKSGRLLLQLGLALKAELESGCVGGKIYGCVAKNGRVLCSTIISSSSTKNLTFFDEFKRTL